VLVNASRPASASSRPYPLRFVPPNGTRGSDATTALTNAAPEVTCRASATARPGSALQTLNPRPYAVALASSTAWASSRATAIAGAVHGVLNPPRSCSDRCSKVSPVAVIVRVTSRPPYTQ